MKKPFDFSKQAVMDLAGADAARALAEDVGTGDLTAGGGITECTRGNLALLLDGRWVTPSLHCGLLAA